MFAFNFGETKAAEPVAGTKETPSPPAAAAPPVSVSSSSNSNRRVHKKGIDAAEARQRRENVTISLRKARREEQLMKRRCRSVIGSGPDMGMNSNSDSPSPGGAFFGADGDQDYSDVDGPLGFPKGSSPEQNQNLLIKITTAITSATQHDGQLLLNVKSLRRIVAEVGDSYRDNITMVLKTNVVEFLINLLKQPVEEVATFPTSTGKASVAQEIQVETAWVLTNLTSGQSDQTHYVMERGLGPVLLHLLQTSQYHELLAQVVWCSANIIGDSPECKRAMIEMGFIPQILKLFTANATTPLLRVATWSLSNFASREPKLSIEIGRPIIQMIAQIMSGAITDTEILVDACWTLHHFTNDKHDTENEKLQLVVESNLTSQLVDLLGQATKLMVPALDTLGSIAAGNDFHTQVVMQCPRIFEKLKALLEHDRVIVRKNVCWILSNFAAGSEDHVATLVNSGILEHCIPLMYDSTFAIQKEITWILCNVCCVGSDHHVMYVTKHDAIPTLSLMLSCPDSEVILAACQALHSILRVGDRHENQEYAEELEECGGLDSLESIQHKADNDDIYDEVCEILSLWFEDVDDDLQFQTQPDTSSELNQFTFGVSGGGGGEDDDGGMRYGKTATPAFNF